MNDLISRQDAVNALDCIKWNDGEGDQCPFEVVAWMPLPEPFKEERYD